MRGKLLLTNAEHIVGNAMRRDTVVSLELVRSNIQWVIIQMTLFKLHPAGSQLIDEVLFF